MFSRLFFVKDPENMVRIVIEGLYPEPYLSQPDEFKKESTNRQRLVKVRCQEMESSVALSIRTRVPRSFCTVTRSLADNR